MPQTELPVLKRCAYCNKNVGVLVGQSVIHEAPVCDEFKRLMAQTISDIITTAGIADYPA